MSSFTLRNEIVKMKKECEKLNSQLVLNQNENQQEIIRLNKQHER